MSDEGFLPERARWPARIAGVTMLALMAAGAWQMADAVRRQTAPSTSRADFLEGRTTAALEKSLAEALPSRDAAIALANGLRYRLLGGAPEAVRTGHDGMLFLTEEMTWRRDAWRNQAARISLLAGTSASLQKQGVALVVVLVPDKARMLQQQVRGGYPAVLSARYQRAAADLRAAGVAVVTLDDALQPRAGQAYYGSDTHWNQRGAHAAADAVAKQVGGMMQFSERAQFRTSETGGPAPRVGDLVKMMGLANAPGWLRPPIDSEAPLQTEQVGAKDVGAAGLFGATAVPVTLVGTSYSLRANFHGFLQEALGVSVLNAARDGAGFLQSIEEYLRNEAFQSDKPKLIIWEVPERFLQAPLGGEKGFFARTGLGPAGD
ncbi:alginate O-acetyltransferase AlgX-related protein [Noviherbaspirillum galbum]|uniref:AlgX/AlgJ SGNH hydrolase-like domain-containing protein n=1 Tax=Noviherbaspirillum galbum TaxID=2709383 RepID=A0A6B3SQP7_9BURK|nr:hypothetical protein [Noviherbaspirillum galbum]NEX61076.1 hypothetical protein [Noviherbaspirillum galbum]